MRVPPGRLTVAAACCAALVALPAAIARATSTGGALATGAGAGDAPTAPAPVRLTTHPARPAPAHTRERRGARRHAHRRRLRGTRPPRDRASALTARVTAHAAGDPGVAIADFHFTPATTTIHVGDTITWSNSGPSSHTATARNGTFNTGILKKGQSASHTFTEPGTFAYVCQIHPFMHGTIVVLAATTSTTTSPPTSAPATSTTSPTATAAAPTATAAAQTGPTLPNTGFDALGGACAGLALLGAGMGLRRARPR